MNACIVNGLQHRAKLRALAWTSSKILALLVVLSAGILTATATARAQESSISLSESGHAILVSVNRVRADYGLHPLQLNTALTQAAQLHVHDMASNGQYSHTGSDGSSVRVRAARVGYASKQGVSENWVATQNATGALAWWMNSYVHRNNILNGKWQDIGVGAERDPANGMMLFVLVFGAGNSGNPGGVLAASATVSAPAPVTAIPAAGMNYTVQPGDTLSGIAARHGISWQRLAESNGLGEFSTLQIGQILRLPGSGTAAGAATGTGGLSDDAPQYMVQSGDTLSTIARRYNITWEELARANGLGATSTLQIGRLLWIPGQPDGGETAVDTPTTATTVAPADSTVKTDRTSTAPTTHVVQPGETVISIALRYNLDWKALLAVNGLSDASLLQIGQTLRLR